MRLIFLFAAFVMMFPGAAAACLSPAGQESQTRYDFSAHKMFYCDGDDWVEVGGGAEGNAASLDGLGCGLSEIPMRGWGGWMCVEMWTGAVERFEMPPYTLLNTYYESYNMVTITGVAAPLPVSMTGQGVPQVSINGGGWTASGTVANGQTVRVRLRSPALPGDLVVATITIGGMSQEILLGAP